MATSRGGMPADPTLSATTDDNARGGLFARSNAGNIVQGVAVDTSTGVNDSTISITLTFADGSPAQTQTFTLNQSETGTLMFTIPEATGGGNQPVLAERVAGGRLEGNNLVLFLNDAQSTTLPPIDISGINTERSEMFIDGRADMRIAAADLQNLNNVPALGSSNQILEVDPNDNTMLRWVDQLTATVMASNFSSPDSTIAIDNETVGNTVTLEARPTWTQPVWTNSGNRGSITGSAQVSEIRLGQNTGFILRAVAGETGVYIIDTPDPVERQPSESVTGPANQNFFDTPVDAVTNITISDGTIASASDVTATATRTVNGVSTAIPAPTIARTSSTTATATVPSSVAMTPGMYSVMTSVFPTNTDGVRASTPLTSTQTFNRFIPFVQSFTDITNETELRAASQSSANWDGRITSNPGTGILYFAVDSTSLASGTMYCTIEGSVQNPRVGFLRTVSVVSGSTTIVYNVFRIGGVQQPTTYINFRTSRFG